MAQAFVQWYAMTSRSKPRQSCEVSLLLAMADELCDRYVVNRYSSLS
jgi:hypothetical protein